MFSDVSVQNRHGASSYSVSKSKMKSRRQGRGDAGVFSYVEEPIADANEDSALIWKRNYPKQAEP